MDWPVYRAENILLRRSISKDTLINTCIVYIFAIQALMTLNKCETYLGLL